MTDQGFNDAETYAFHVARGSFLSLWSYLNPVRPDNGKELCDILVAFGEHLLVFSVKDIKLTEHEDAEVPMKRWQRKAIDGSVKQLDGAQRVLSKLPHVITKDGEEGLPFPEDTRKVHRIAVAFGSNGEVPLYQGPMGNGFTHVFDEVTLEAAMAELDTITDFVEYLDAKEQLFNELDGLLIEAHERDLIAMYLFNNRKFETKAPDGEEIDFMVVTDGWWDAMLERPEYKAKKEADKISYAWDYAISMVAQPHLDKHPECVGTLSDAEQVLRVMAAERRFYRRMLGSAHYEFCKNTTPEPNRVFRRVTESPSGVLYVFQGVPGDWEREKRVGFLEATMHVARGLNGSNRVVGFSTTNKGWGGHQEDLMYLESDSWTDADQEHMEFLQTEVGILTNTKITKGKESEYPE